MLFKLFSLISFTLIALGVSLTPIQAQSESSLEITQTNLELNNLLLKGKQYVEQQNYDQALETYEQAAILDQQNPEIFSGIGYVQTLRKDYSAAVAAYEQAIALAPDDPKLYYALGFSLGNAGKNLQAAKAYEKSVELEPDNVQNYLGLGLVLLRAKKYTQALKIYNNVLKLEPGNEQANTIIPRILMEKG
ncbi:MAG: tetratricopeptide repeat protein, partial [Waterburya sp.]